jgi:hypothetical protein
LPRCCGWPTASTPTTPARRGGRRRRPGRPRPPGAACPRRARPGPVGRRTQRRPVRARVWPPHRGSRRRGHPITPISTRRADAGHLGSHSWLRSNLGSHPVHLRTRGVDGIPLRLAAAPSQAAWPTKNLEQAIGFGPARNAGGWRRSTMRSGTTSSVVKPKSSRSTATSASYSKSSASQPEHGKHQWALTRLASTGPHTGLEPAFCQKRVEGCRRRPSARATGIIRTMVRLPIACMATHQCSHGPGSSIQWHGA